MEVLYNLLGVFVVYFLFYGIYNFVIDMRKEYIKWRRR